MKVPQHSYHTEFEKLLFTERSEVGFVHVPGKHKTEVDYVCHGSEMASVAGPAEPLKTIPFRSKSWITGTPIPSVFGLPFTENRLT